MASREAAERAEQRSRRKFEIFRELATPGADQHALLAEYQQLSADDENYAAGLLAEIDADHTISAAAVEVQRENLAEQVAIASALLPIDLPANSPLRRMAELIAKYAHGQALANEEHAWLETQVRRPREGE